MKNSSKRIWELVELEVFSSIDFYFAKNLLQNLPIDVQESHFFVLSYLLAAARNGHLCIRFSDESIDPGPAFLSSDPQIQREITENVLSNWHSLSFLLVEDVYEKEKIPLKPVCRSNDCLYLQKNWILESECIKHLVRMSRQTEFRLKLEKSISFNPLLNKEQNSALSIALSSSLSLISGGPGTGKTYTAAQIVKTFLDNLSDEDRSKALVKIAAPTGKAAALLEKKIKQGLDGFSGIQCGTLHSLLQMKGGFETKTTSLFADLFLVDEASMIDAKLFSKLLTSFQKGGRLVFIGDKNQLPPVESGALFADLMDHSQVLSIPSALLTDCLRAEKKELIDFAKDLMKGPSEKILNSSFVRLFNSSEVSSIRETVWKMSLENFSQHPNEFHSFRVLSAIRKGPLGVESLNEMILYRLLREKKDDDLFSASILITENYPSLGLVNGDIGYLVAKVSSFKRKRFELEDRAYFDSLSFSANALPSFEWGYCLSIHKSQGSEYEKVLALFPRGSEGFGKEILYTAATRAKKEMLLLGDESIFISILEKSARKRSGIGSEVLRSQSLCQTGVL